ncbi:hypothetical protein INR49_008846, partial [Caranx melampygus]
MKCVTICLVLMLVVLMVELSDSRGGEFRNAYNQKKLRKAIERINRYSQPMRPLMGGTQPFGQPLGQPFGQPMGQPFGQPMGQPYSFGQGY